VSPLLARILAVAALVAAAIIMVLFYRGKMLDAQADLETEKAKVTVLEATNTANEKEMVRLQAAAEANAAIAEAVAGRKMEITVRTQEGRAAIAEARRNDPDVKDYLDQPAPDPVRGVLNAGIATGSDQDSR